MEGETWSWSRWWRPFEEAAPGARACYDAPPMRFLPLVALAACATPHAPPPAPPTPPAPARTWVQPRALVFRHATVMPASAPAIADGAVAFEAGKIVAVGKDAEAKSPTGALEVDFTGKFITPGIIDAHSHLGVYASPETNGSDDGNEATAPVTAEVDAADSFWPQDPGLRRA